MAKGLVNETTLNNLGNAINVLNGTSGTYAPSEMGEAIIDAIPTETASGNPIHITDAAAYPAMSCVTSLEPVQDLHGYDKPWPAGGGKNLCPISENEFIPSYTWVSLDGQNANTYTNGTEVFLRAGTYTFWFSEKTNIETAQVIGSESGTLVNSPTTTTFTCNTDDTLYIRIKGASSGTAVSFKLQLEAGSTATSYEPYSNECPISGHTGAELTRAGKNLYPIKIGADFYSDNAGGTHSNSDGVLVINTINSQSSGVYSGYTNSSKLYTLSKLLNGTYTYSFSVKCSSDNTVFIGYSSFGRKNINVTTEWQRHSITANFNNTVSVFTIYCNNATTIEVKDFQCEEGSTATSYEPYTPETHSVTFPQDQSPVYGGEVDWVNGVLRVDYASVDLSSLSWTTRYEGEINRTYSTTLPNVYYKTSSEFVAEQYVFNNAVGGASNLNNPDTRNVGMYSYNGTMDAEIEGCSNVFYMVVPIDQNINGKLVYKFATPLEIPLTPEVITLLKGENNLFTDAGTSEIEYKVDLNLYIQKLIDEVSASASALSVSPLSLGKSAVLTSTDGEGGEKIEEVDEPLVFDEVKVSDDVESVDEADAELTR